MNNRQAGAYRELVRKEERAREKWLELHGSAHPQPQQQANGQPGNTVQLQQQQQATYQPQQTQQQPQQQSYQQTGYPQQSFGNSFNATGSLPLASSSIYDQALRISSPRLQDDGVDIPSTVQRRVVRQVEVPFTRQVKTQVTTRQLVPHIVEKKVRTTKLVEVPSTKLVNEEYTEVIHQPAIRNKEIWVKKIVPERYSQAITVKKTRQVSVPTTVLKQVDDWEIVQVTENKAIDVPGFRIDEVQDSKLVEVEELQNYQLQPTSTGQAQVLSYRDIGPVNGFHHSRRLGTEVFHPQDPRHAMVEEDQQPFSGTNRGPASAKQQQQPHTGRSNTFRSSGQAISGSNTARSELGTTSDLDRSIGFKVRDGDANGVVVYRVSPGEAAERAGVRTGDVVIYCNNRPSRNLAEFRQVLNASSGPVLLQVRRRGAQKLMLTLHR